MFRSKLKTFLNRKSKAQHIVEFAIMAPFFIIALAFIIPIITVNFQNFQFVYKFNNAINLVLPTLTIDNNPEAPYNEEERTYNFGEYRHYYLDESGNYKPVDFPSGESFSNDYEGLTERYQSYIRHRIRRVLSDYQGGDLIINVIDPTQNDKGTGSLGYITGSYKPAREIQLLFGVVGKEYYSFVFPVNASYLRPVLLTKKFADDEGGGGGGGSGEATMLDDFHEYYSNRNHE